MITRSRRRSFVSVALGGSLLSAVLAFIVGVAPVAAAAGWTSPTLVGPAAFCDTVAAAIDAAGRPHVVADCGGAVRYTSRNANGSWSTTVFARPAGVTDRGPQIAIDGNVVTVAFSRNNPDVTCGWDWLGVYVRTRTLPAGAWSAATRIGRVGDHLQSMRAVGGAIHVTVDATDGHVYYERIAHGTTARYLLADAVGITSLRVGSDGAARIAYEGAHALRYAVFTGSGFHVTSIPGTNAGDHLPLLVLDGANAAHVLWTHTTGPGCGGGEGSPKDGTYYATNAGGSWTPAADRRFTGEVGETSMTLDTATGRVHAVVGAADGLWYFTMLPGHAWTTQKLSSTAVWSVTIRMDAASGALFVFFVREPTDTASASVFAMTHR